MANTSQRLAAYVGCALLLSACGNAGGVNPPNVIARLVQRRAPAAPRVAGIRRA